MVTVAELSLAEELRPVQEIASSEGWKLEKRDAVSFVLGLPARDGTWFWLLCRCHDYPAMPPAWHWYSTETTQVDQPQDIPKGGGFFHGSGVICAPWNVLAYSSADPRGPHSDWTVGNWRANSKTGGCKTIAAMALRIAVELQAASFGGRLG